MTPIQRARKFTPTIGRGTLRRLQYHLSSFFASRRKDLRSLYRQRFFFTYDHTYDDLAVLRKKMNRYFRLYPSRARAYRSELDFINIKAVESNFFSFIFPYPFSISYQKSDVKVFKDEYNGLFYVLHQGKKLYYHRGYTSPAAVQDSYTGISIEQDDRSPHRYLEGAFTVAEGDIVADLGAAEGNFSLEIVEKAGQLYLFEADSRWIEALQATFAPWKSKVHIIDKYVADVDDAHCIKLGTVLGDGPVQFIKMDIEGAEVSVLKTLTDILARNPTLKLAVCAYHRQTDAETISKILNDNGYDATFTNGNMLFPEGVSKPPYFRKCLIRAQKERAAKVLPSVE